MQLTHKDVQLWYFERVQHTMAGLFSGNRLTVVEDGLADANRTILLKYSQKCKDALKARYDKGFNIAAAKVNFVVYWKGEDKEKEVKIILPVSLLKRIII